MLVVRILTLFTLLAATPCFGLRLIRDELGRNVRVPDHPRRVICLAPGVTDTVFALGGGDDVVAITDFTKYPSAALKKPSVGTPMHPSLETILSLHPDLVIGMQTGRPLEANTQIEKLGIPVFLIQPHGLEGVLHSIASTGDAIDRKPQAAALVAALQARIDAVRARTHTLPRTSVFMPIWYDPIITIGRHAFITEIIEAAGGRSITDDMPTEWPQMSLEALIARAPEALLLERGGRTTFESLKDRPGWGSLPAIQAHKVFYVDDRIELASPVAIDALEDLADQFHPRK